MIRRRMHPMKTVYLGKLGRALIFGILAGIALVSATTASGDCPAGASAVVTICGGGCSGGCATWKNIQGQPAETPTNRIVLTSTNDSAGATGGAGFCADIGT